MERFISPAILGTLLMMVMVPAVGQEKKETREITIRGEVIDVKCYMTGKIEPSHGKAHKDCALRCANAGVPLALLEDGTRGVYLAIKQKNGSSANDMLIPFVAEKVSVTGKIVERGGTRLLLIETVERAQ